MNRKTDQNGNRFEADMEAFRLKVKAEAEYISNEKLPKTNIYYIDDVFEQVKETVLLSQKIFDKSIKLRVVVKKYLPRQFITALKSVKAKLSG